jgi:hypothetical protein
MYKNDQDFYYIGTNEEAGIGKVLMRFKKGEGQENLELAKHKVVDFFSQLKKGAHSDKKFVFKAKDETPAEAFEHLALMKLSKEHYRANGTGRPTKKERREIDDFISDDDSFIGNEE